MKDRKLMQLAVAAAPNPSAAPNAGAGATGAAGQGGSTSFASDILGSQDVSTQGQAAGGDAAPSATDSFSALLAAETGGAAKVVTASGTAPLGGAKFGKTGFDALQRRSRRHALAHRPRARE